MKKYLLIDSSNILYKTFFVHKGIDDLTIAGMATHSALITMNKYFKQFKPHKIILAFDRSSWRKEYTASDQCVSKRPYKGGRRLDMSPKEKERYQLFLNHINDFETMVRDHTAIMTLACDRLEADDLVAGFVQTVGVMEEDAEFIIISSDKDFIQLLGYSNVRLINPADGKDRTLEEWNGDAELFLFEKCIRGEMGKTKDNIQSALPKCRATRIVRAYQDPYEKANLMMETWNDKDGKTFKVKELFDENRLLVDLRCQPEDIQKATVKTVLESINKKEKFSLFHFLKFCGKYELKNISKSVDTLIPMLS